MSRRRGASLFDLRHAGVTKGIILLSGAATGTVFLFSNYAPPVLTARAPLWEQLRVVSTGLLSCSRAADFLFSSALMFHFRQLERQMGSSKFAAFLAISTSIGIVFQLVFAALFPSRVAIYQHGSLVLPLFACMGFSSWREDRGTSSGNRFLQRTSSFLPTFLGLNLAFSRGVSSFAAAVAGSIGGSMYRRNIFGVQRFSFGGFVGRFAENWIAPLLGETGVHAETHVMPRVRQVPGTDFVENLATSAPSPPPPLIEPDEEHVNTLVSMGFPRAAASAALVNARNDLQVATNALLEAH